MREFIKTWWHCLWRIHKKGHRMCKITPKTIVISTWFKPYWICECKTFMFNLDIIEE